MPDKTYTIQDLITTTGRTRRAIQNVVSHYEVFTGQHIQRVQQRNFLALKFTEEQFETIKQAMQAITQGDDTYQTFFQRLTGQAPATSPAPASLTDVPAITTQDWQDFLKRFTSLEEKVTAVQTKLETIEAEASATKVSTNQLTEHFLDLATELSNYILPKHSTPATS